MRSFLPSKFGWRERLLSLVAILMAVAFGWITCVYAGQGAGVAWIFFTAFGTVLLIAIAGSDRCFFTALFTTLFVALMSVSFLYGCFFDHWHLYLKDAVFLVCLMATTVILPTAFAWFATRILRYARRDA